MLGAVAVSLSAQEAVRSAPLEIIYGKPFVMVMVNGKGPFRFVIDTGTGGQAFVSAELADELSLPSAGNIRLKDPTGQGMTTVPLVQLQSLNVAGVEFKAIKAIRHALNFDGTYCQGLLGFTLFRDYLLTLDYPGKRMTLSSGELAQDKKNSIIPFRMPDGIPIVHLQIGSEPVEAQLDSGGTGLSLPEHVAARLKFAVGPTAFASGQSLSTRFRVNGGQLASDVHLGRYTFAQPFVEINPAFPLANFGSCPMQSFVFTFDQRNLLVRLDAEKRLLHLAATPAPLRLETAPDLKPSTPSLVPVG
jgi:predicted aspartyl protease